MSHRVDLSIPSHPMYHTLIQGRVAALRQLVGMRISKLQALLPQVPSLYPQEIVAKTEQIKERIQYLRDLNIKKMTEYEMKWMTTLIQIIFIYHFAMVGAFQEREDSPFIFLRQKSECVRERPFREGCIRRNRSVPLPACPALISPDRLPASLGEAESLIREVTRRIPTFDALWHKRLTELPYQEKRVAQLGCSVRSKDFAKLWNQSCALFEEEDFQLYLIPALRRGVLTQHEFGTLIRYQECDQFSKQHAQPRPLCMALFTPSGEVCGKASEFLWASLKYKGKPVLTKEQQGAFIDLARALSPLEQTFLLAPDTVTYSSKTVVEAILGLEYNLFFKVIEDSQTWQVEASFGLYQTLFRTLNPHDPVLLNPVCNISSLDDLRNNNLSRRRDVGLQSVFCPRIPLADSFSAPGTQFSKHDFYHSHLINRMPKTNSLLNIKIAESLKHFSHSETLQELLYDAEFPLYNAGLSPGIAFWYSLLNCFCIAQDKRLKEGVPLMSVSEELQAIRHMVPIILGNEATPEISTKSLNDFALAPSFETFKDSNIPIEYVLLHSRNWETKLSGDEARRVCLKYKFVVFCRVVEELRRTLI